MPIMNGFNSLSASKKDNLLKHLLVLMAIAEACEDDIVRAAQDGTGGYIVKPVTTAMLEDKGQKILQKAAVRSVKVRRP